MNAKTVFAFLAGAAVGSFVTWKYVKKTYFHACGVYEEDFTESEEGETTETEEPAEEGVAPWRAEKPDILEYYAKLNEAKYTLKADTEYEEKGGVEPMDYEKPCIISPEEFGEEDEYETVSLFYHADGVLTDTQNNIIENADELVGLEYSNHFGEYEDDSVFIRNDDIGTYFEILKDPSNYTVIDSEPHSDEE